MAKKALSINFPVERVVLSDILPYEVPIVFSNRYFYRFICKHSVRYHDSTISWRSDGEALDKLILMLLGIPFDKKINKEILTDGTEASTVKLERNEASSIPFTFSTTHKKDQLRQLSLMHPRAQLLVVDFYDEFKDLMIYYSGRSDFSLRAPTRVAGCTYIDPRAHIERKDNADSLVELEGDDYENLRSFFVYERFSNVFKFYESREHLRCEQDFQFLTKLDISSCFDGIYTHSISWAIYGKEFAKSNLNKLHGSFPGRFDWLMQKTNHNETNGILIGPEVSRIFAEIILQAVDRDVFFKLARVGLNHEKDYHIYRYVDDFFIFHNDMEVCHQIKMTLQESLKTYKLSLNKGKEETLARPIITSISIAKKRISDLFDRSICYEIASEIEEGEVLPRGRVYIGKSSLITDFKSILSTSGVTYGEILNYSLSVVERKIATLIDNYKNIEKRDGVAKSFSKAIEAAIGFVFFIYSVSPKVNTTIKLCRICQRVIAFYREDPIGPEYGPSTYQVIYERCRTLLSTSTDGGAAKIEVMYLLVLMRQLGKHYRIDEITLAGYFDFECNKEPFKAPDDLNYFAIVTLLFYTENIKRYSRLKAAIIHHIREKFSLRQETLYGDSEMLHLALDIVSCPFLDKSLKGWVLELYGVPKKNLSIIQKYSDCWFTKWGEFDLSRELDAKVSQEVY